MTGLRILSIDQGTTNTKAILVDASGEIIAQASAPLTSSYPRPGWAEQSAIDIWTSVQAVIAAIVQSAGADGIAGLAISNQRETLVVWDSATGQPIAPAIIWQCRRTADICAALHDAGMNPAVEAATGLGINPLFPASKLGWVLANNDDARRLAAAGRLRAGTVDSWLLWNLTGGKSFATDHSNASRTQLFNTETLSWDENLGEIFAASISVLPEVRTSDSLFGETAPGSTTLPAGIAIRAMMGDSHAALYGHGVRMPGVVKATYGTGSSLMALTPGRITSRHGLSGTIGWSTKSGVAYAIEGNITVSAQAAAFMTSLLGIASVQALSDLAEQVGDSGGVTFIPALAGLGAPHWNDQATGTISGMTHGTTPAHLARATFEAIALQIVDVFQAIEADTATELAELRADGGASANDFLMQLQADCLGRPVRRCDVAEIGALGAAAMAFGSLGIEMDTASAPGAAQIFRPAEDRTVSRSRQDRWQSAIRRVTAKLD